MAIPAYYSLIQNGSTGPDVALVQTWLNGVRDSCTWYPELTVDGRFGTKSENAVKEFQLKNSMNMDGKVGANTWNVLYTKYTAKHGLNVPYPGVVLRSGTAGGTVRLVQQKLNSLGEKLTTVLYPGLCRSACGGYAAPAENDLVCGQYVLRFKCVETWQRWTASRRDQILIGSR